jgi:AmiR/NasT family two-component response regulator
MPVLLSAMSFTAAPQVGECWTVKQVRPPQVLLGNLEPIMVLGLQRVLAEDGIDVIGQEPNPGRIVVEAGRLQPDVVLIDRGDDHAKALSRQVQDVAPQTKVILWARDETVMEVLDPASDRARLVALTAHGELRSELTSARNRQRVEE